MDLEDIQKELKHMLKPKRFHHSEGVADMAKKLAEQYGADPEKAYLAGWVHDCAKELPLGEMQQVARDGGLTLDAYMMGSRALLHGPAGSVLAEKKFGISDPDIRSAIYYHTTGQPHMTLMQKIIFLADYIEPSRDFPGVEHLRDLAFQDLDTACLAAYDSTITHLIDQKAYIYDLTFLGRNDLVLEMEHHDGK